MLRRTLLLAGPLLAVGAAAYSIFWAQRQVPEFYEEALAAQPDPVERRVSAEQFARQTMTLIDDLREAEDWSQQFEEGQVNAWLAERLVSEFRELVPPEVHDPRVRFVDGAVLLGFRHESPNWRGVVSLALRPRVAAPNRLEIEFSGVQAGLIPIPLDTVTEQISARMAAEGWRTAWHERDGYDVIVVELDGNDDEQPVLEEVDVSPGELRIAGTRRSSEDEPSVESNRAVPAGLSAPQLADQPDGEDGRN